MKFYITKCVDIERGVNEISEKYKWNKGKAFYIKNKIDLEIVKPSKSERQRKENHSKSLKCNSFDDTTEVILCQR